MSRYEDLQQHLRAEPATWLVTGAAGFIGSNLVERLLELGQTVVALDDATLEIPLGQTRAGDVTMTGGVIQQMGAIWILDNIAQDTKNRLSKILPHSQEDRLNPSAFVQKWPLYPALKFAVFF